MAESEYDGRVILEWPSPNGLAESEWYGRVRVMWPNHPGRVRLAVRIILAESDWLAE